MSDLKFEAQVSWLGALGERRGNVETGGEQVPWSVPASMGGLGEGSSPEEFLLAAVGTCFSATLGGVLRQAHLPAGAIRVRVEGLVTGYPTETRYAEVRVHPEVDAGDASRLPAYREAALTARSRCFIGGIVGKGLDYVLGDVTVHAGDA